MSSAACRVTVPTPTSESRKDSATRPPIIKQPTATPVHAKFGLGKARLMARG